MTHREEYPQRPAPLLQLVYIAYHPCAHGEPGRGAESLDESPDDELRDCGGGRGPDGGEDEERGADEEDGFPAVCRRL